MIRIDEYIVLETNEFVAINKPAGLLTIPDREGKLISLKQILKKKYGEIFTVHRLDKETSGLVIFAKTDVTHKHLSMQFEKRETEKIYHGLVLGTLINKEGIINEPIAEHPTKKGLMTVYKKGKESVTEYKVLEEFRLYSWLQFKILTGRTHQIRVHMKHAGHPIVCDELYGDGKSIFISQIKSKYNLAKNEEERPILSRLALHSYKLSFRDIENKEYHLEADLPKDLKATLKQLSRTKIM